MIYILILILIILFIIFCNNKEYFITESSIITPIQYNLADINMQEGVLTEKDFQVNRSEFAKRIHGLQEYAYVLGNKKYGTINIYFKNPKKDVREYTKIIIDLFKLVNTSKYPVELIAMGDDNKISDLLYIFKNKNLNTNFIMNYNKDLWRYREEEEITNLEMNNFFNNYYGVTQHFSGMVTSKSFFRHRIVDPKYTKHLLKLTTREIILEKYVEETPDDTLYFIKKYHDELSFLEQPYPLTQNLNNNESINFPDSKLSCRDMEARYIPIYKEGRDGSVNWDKLGRNDIQCEANEYLNKFILEEQYISHLIPDRMIYKYKCCKIPYYSITT